MSNLLFSSGFEGSVALTAPRSISSREAWQDLAGTDSVTGFSWPGNVFGGQWSIQMLNGGGNLNDVIRNSIDTTTGHDGKQTRALHLSVLQRVIGDTQDPLLIQPTTSPTDLYASEWIKLPANLGAKLGGPGGWMSVGPEWKSAGDFRIDTLVEVDGNGVPHWVMKWDNNANGGLPAQTFWNSNNNAVLVPQDQWFHIEMFTHRSATNGQSWLKVNDQIVFDHTAPTIGQKGAPIDRIFMGNPYGSAPVDMYVDDIQVRDGIPNPVVTNPPPPPPPPVTATNTLQLSLSEDAWQGDAQAVITVDGKAVGGTVTVTAPHAQGKSQAVTLTGQWGAGAHDVGIQFINDAYGGTTAADRNLYVNGVALDGQASATPPANLYSNGTAHFAVAAASPLVLQMSEDAYLGDAQFTVAVDGKTLGAAQPVTALHAKGAVQSFAFNQIMTAGTHDVAVSFLNDAYGGSSATDRNLYVNSIVVNGAPMAGTAATLLNASTQHFSVVVAAHA